MRYHFLALWAVLQCLVPIEKIISHSLNYSSVVALHFVITFLSSHNSFHHIHLSRTVHYFWYVDECHDMRGYLQQEVTQRICIEIGKSYFKRPDEEKKSYMAERHSKLAMNMQSYC